MATKASDLFIQCLEQEGVEYIFGVPGEENLDMLDSLSRSKQIKLILTRGDAVAHVTSLPLFENSLNCFNSSSPRYTTEAYARPTARGICAAVGETSSATLYISI